MRNSSNLAHIFSCISVDWKWEQKYRIVIGNIAYRLSLPSFPSRTPSGLEDVSKYPALFAGLLASGTWTLDDLKKLAGLNFLRVLREVERVREREEDYPYPLTCIVNVSVFWSALYGSRGP